MGFFNESWIGYLSIIDANEFYLDFTFESFKILWSRFRSLALQIVARAKFLFEPRSWSILDLLNLILVKR